MPITKEEAWLSRDTRGVALIHIYKVKKCMCIVDADYCRGHTYEVFVYTHAKCLFTASWDLRHQAQETGFYIEKVIFSASEHQRSFWPFLSQKR